MKRFLFFILICSAHLAFAQQAAPKTLKVINDLKQYELAVAADPNQKIVELNQLIPDIVLDIRYATTNNFMKEVMYDQARAFARKPVAEALKRVQADLKKQGLGLKIFDGYRPYAITLEFYKKASDKNFVADPKFGSKHNRGCAIDLTLIDLKTKKELKMPTPYDSFEKAAAANYSNLPAAVIKNRQILIQAMEKQGFKVLSNEWWHFDFVGWQNYDVMDIPFNRL